MHPEGSKCVDNEPGQFYLGHPDSKVFLRCEDYKEKCGDSSSTECQSLAFICLDEGLSTVMYFAIMVGALVVLTTFLVVAYCCIKAKLQNALRIETELSSQRRGTLEE